MRLTNYIREAFVSAAMNDVPAPEKFEEKAHNIIKDDALNQLPPKIQAIAKDKELSWFLYQNSFWFRSSPFHTVYVPAARGKDYVPSAEAKKKIDELAAAANADKDMRIKLKDKLMGAARACTTTKQLRELLPEFEQYLPLEEEATCRTLPAVANIMSDFVKAGWPKDAKKMPKEKALV